MKSVRSGFVVCASLLLALSACSRGEVEAAPSTASPATDVASSAAPEQPSCDDSGVECDDYGNPLGENESIEGDPNESNSVTDLDDTRDPDAVSCDEPNIICDDYGNVLNPDTPTASTNPDAEEDSSISSKSSDGREDKRFTPYDRNCVSTYPNIESGGYYASFALTPVYDDWIPEGGVDHSYTIESLGGDVYFKCETNMGAIRTFGLPDFIKEPVRAHGVMDGHEFDIIFNVNEYGTGSNDREVEYYQILFNRDVTPGELVISEGFPWDSHQVILENNA